MGTTWTVHLHLSYEALLCSSTFLLCIQIIHAAYLVVGGAQHSTALTYWHMHGSKLTVVVTGPMWMMWHHVQQH